MDTGDLVGGEGRANRSVPGSPCRYWTSAEVETLSWLPFNTGPASLVAGLQSAHSLSWKPSITQSLAFLGYSPFSAYLSTEPYLKSPAREAQILASLVFVFSLRCVALLPWPPHLFCSHDGPKTSLFFQPFPLSSSPSYFRWQLLGREKEGRIPKCESLYHLKGGSTSLSLIKYRLKLQWEIISHQVGKTQSSVTCDSGGKQVFQDLAGGNAR